MSVSKPLAAAEESRQHQLTKAVDDAGRVWSHANPLQLYRFIHKRNQLLKAIAAGPR